MAAQAKTNAIRLLESAGIPFETVDYEVDESDLSGGHIAEQMGAAPESMFKTLVMKGEKKGFFVCCLPVADELDLKKVAKAFGDKKVDLIPMKDLKDLTGYIRGGCTTFCRRRRSGPATSDCSRARPSRRRTCRRRRSAFPSAIRS